jgi:hypothetical protein
MVDANSLLVVYNVNDAISLIHILSSYPWNDYSLPGSHLAFDTTGTISLIHKLSLALGEIDNSLLCFYLAFDTTSTDTEWQDWNLQYDSLNFIDSSSSWTV